MEGRADRLTGDAGVIALREFDERLGLSQWLADGTIDRRDPRLITHDLVELFRTRFYMMVLGHRNQDDCGRLETRTHSLNNKKRGAQRRT